MTESFAPRCAQPFEPDEASGFVNRLLDDGAVERDQMSGPTKRDWVVFLDMAAELKPNEIAVSGTRDGKPIDGVWWVEEKRMLQIEASWDGKKIHRRRTTATKWTRAAVAQKM